MIHLSGLLQGYMRDVEIRGAFADGFLADGTGIYGGDTTAIDHCRIEKCGSYGIQFNNVVQPSVHGGTHVEANIAGGIFFDANAAQPAVDGCSFQNNSGRSVECGGTGSPRITNNDIEVSGGAGIFLSAVVGGVVLGNTIRGSGKQGAERMGIRLFGATHTRVSDNYCTDAAIGNQLYGFLEDNAGDFNQVTSNDLTGNITRAIQAISGTHSIYRDNQGYNPVGALAAGTGAGQFPAFPATGVTITNSAATDVTYYIVNGTSAMTLQVDAVVVGIIPASGFGTVRIPAGSTFKPTYAGGAPTAVAYGE
jgi:hypothetical protein